MNKVSTSPLVAGIKAARDNAIPLVVILLAAAGLVIAYRYQVPFVVTALNYIGALNKANPMAFAAICTAITSGLIPWIFRMVIRGLRPPHPLGDLVHSMVWWAAMGMLVSYFYQLQAAWFGDEANLRTVLLKVSVDMVGFTILIGAPFNAISHLWKDCGWDTARLRAAMGRGWYRRLVLPNLLTNYFVWFPGALIFYNMPTDLQLVVANCIGCFWALMCARIAAHSGVPITDVHA
ncbi:MAG: hypothetical protein D4R66_01180 [Opitutales bacterium]|jgi:hypothetical protein|nr:MAG: hypothetical protein D4R66_01180 [Opitutales bacterium]